MAKSRIQMIVDGEVFPSKKKLTERCQQILHGFKINETLPEAETRFLTSLIESYHPEAALKIGCGVRRMWPGLNEYGGVGFYLERHDGSSTDWSFMKSINNPSKWHDFHAACRNAIMDQTISFSRYSLERREFPVNQVLIASQQRRWQVIPRMPLPAEAFVRLHDLGFSTDPISFHDDEHIVLVI